MSTGSELLSPPPVRKCWSRGPAERMWGETFNSVRRNSGKLPANFSANLDGEFIPRTFRPCFSRVSGPPPLKIHAQDSHPKIVGVPLQFHFLDPQFFPRRFSAYRGDQQMLRAARLQNEIAPNNCNPTRKTTWKTQKMIWEEPRRLRIV